MKTVVLVGDGMGDHPQEELDGKTPLQAAHIPNMRLLAGAGEVRMVRTIPDGMQPGSDVANLDLLGYNPVNNYTGRAPIECAGAGIRLSSSDVAYRCNLVTVKDDCMEDYSSGHISTKEAHQLIEALENELGRDGLRFHGGVQYRHLLVWKEGPTECTTEPPHEFSGKPVADNLPSGKRAKEVRKLMEASKKILAEHPVNLARIQAGKNPATQIWLWGQGKALTLGTYAASYGITGGIITAVDLVRGLGVLAGLDTPRVPGVTGLIDTNYDGKVEAAKDILEKRDFAYVHVEAPDECGHMGDAKLKTKAIELFDERVVGPLWGFMESLGEPYQLLVCMDHRTPVELRGHTAEPVPMTLVEGPVGSHHTEADFDEFVNNGEPECFAHDWIQDILSADT